MKRKSCILAMISMLLLESCLKDKAIINYSNIPPIIIVPNANRPSNNPINTTTYSQADGLRLVNLYARISWEFTLDKDIIVTFSEDPNAVTAYNNQFGENFIIMPASGYNISATTLVIPKGSKDAFLPITIDPINLIPASNYMLAFTISDAQGKDIAENYKTWVMPVEIIP